MTRAQEDNHSKSQTKNQHSNTATQQYNNTDSHNSSTIAQQYHTKVQTRSTQQTRATQQLTQACNVPVSLLWNKLRTVRLTSLPISVDMCPVSANRNDEARLARTGKAQQVTMLSNIRTTQLVVAKIKLSQPDELVEFDWD
jgi:hypothetical protein